MTTRKKTAARTPLRRGTLTRDMILRGALELIDREGLETLSLRKIAAHLGVSPMSLYRHYRNMSEIEVDIVDHVVGASGVTHHGEKSCDRWVLATYAAMREVLCAHPGLMPLLDSASFNAAYRGMNALKMVETTLGKLREAGLTPGQSAQLFHILTAYLIGSVVMMDRTARDVVAAGASDTAEHTRLRRLALEIVPMQQFPNVATMAPHLAAVWESGEFRSDIRQIIKPFLEKPAKKRK